MTKQIDMLQGMRLVPSVFPLAMSALGILGLVYGDFALQWQPVPDWLPGRHGVAYVSAALLLLGGIGVFIKPVSERGALVLVLVLFSTWVLPQALKVAAATMSVGSLLGLCETLAAMSGGWLLWAEIAGRGTEVARRLFGICCVIFGLSHFAYADFTASMIPQWIPARLVFAYATGAGHIAAGLCIALAIRPRLAATLEALMMSSFVILLHIPSLWADPPPDWAPTVRIQLTALFWASALAGSAWLAAASLRSTSPSPRP
jgi:uncharacterized membrane protein